MFHPGKTGRAIGTDAGTTAKARIEPRAAGPRLGLRSQRALDVGKAFGFRLSFGGQHVRMPYNAHAITCQKYKDARNSAQKMLAGLIQCWYLSFTMETRLRLGIDEKP